MSLHSIYALCDPDTGDVRYVGSTSTSLYQRLYVHISSSRSIQAKNGTPKLREWISGLLEEGKRPTISLLAECASDKASETERQFILSYHNNGCNLLNVRGKPGRAAKAPERAILLRLSPSFVDRFDLVVSAKYTTRAALVRELMAREVEAFFAARPQAQP
jgi:hypothetical protein